MPNRELLLLALDDSPTLQLMQRALSATEYELAIVQDKKRLWKTLESSSPALMLIGERFAGEEGLRLAGEMLERFPTLPILLYADEDTDQLAKETLRAGLSGYLFPPLRTDDIRYAVEHSLARARRLGDWLRREVKRTTSSLEERARLSEADLARYEAIFSTIQDGVIVLDTQNKILFLNPAVRDMYQVTEKEPVGKPLLEVITHPDLRSLMGRASEEPLKYHEINLDSGQVLNAQFTPIPGIGAAITMQDISYLKELDRLKNDFVHTVSHDLRSPLTALLGYAELIDRIGPLSEQQREFLRRIQASVQHITTLVNDLLDLGRLEAGYDMRRETVWIDSILKYTLDTFDSQAREKKIQLSSTLAPEIPPLRANPIRIRQLMDNLVGNAIKYTPPEGRVHVGIAARDKQVIIEVRDTGPGIPKTEQNRIFEKFYRASNAPEGASGSGLGLAIVKSILDIYQGRIWVESKIGQGSSFFVVLPAQDQGP
jgi:signal transduction histidine kinase